MKRMNVYLKKLSRVMKSLWMKISQTKISVKIRRSRNNLQKPQHHKCGHLGGDYRPPAPEPEPADQLGGNVGCGRPAGIGLVIAGASPWFGGRVRWGQAAFC